MNWLKEHQITIGTFDSTGNCEYDVPNHISIGDVYSDLIIELVGEATDLKPVDIMYDVFTSFISDEMLLFTA